MEIFTESYAELPNREQFNVNAEPGIFGNVHQLCPAARVEKSSRPNKKGQLVFDARFESGNLGRVHLVSEAEYDLYVRPDTCNARQRLWFYFSVSNTWPGQRVVFNIVNFSKLKTLLTENDRRASIVVRTPSGKSWKRLPCRSVHYDKSAAHGNRPVFSFAFTFDDVEDGGDYRFSYCFPYTYSDLQQYLQEVDARRLPYYRRDTLALTTQHRTLDLVTITEINSCCSDLSTPRTPRFSDEATANIVFITARVHPGETPSSFVCQGLMDFLLSNDTLASALRRRYVFKIVPMLNPDGVYLGNYRASLMGFDLNRHWQMPSTWAHPTIRATKRLLMQLNNNPRTPLAFYIDLHAHTQRQNCFFYGNVFVKDKERCNRQLILPHLMQRLSPKDFCLDYTQFNTDEGKAGTGRRALGSALQSSCLCYTLEVSFFSYRSVDDASTFGGKTVAYTETDYLLLGENLARALNRYWEWEQGRRQVPLERSFASFVTAQTPSSKAASASQGKKPLDGSANSNSTGNGEQLRVNNKKNVRIFHSDDRLKRRVSVASAAADLNRFRIVSNNTSNKPTRYTSGKSDVE